MMLFIIANPSSGHSQARKVIQYIISNYPEVEVNVFLTRYAGDEAYQVTELLKVYKPQDRVLILGGDGTLSKVLKELPVDISFAYYPTGSGNDFARSLSINSLSDIMQALLKDRKQPITLLNYQDGIVANSLDFGFVARVISYSENSLVKNQLKKVGFGKLAYLIYAVKTLFTNQSVDMELVINHQKKVLNNLFFITFANNRYFGGGIMIWPHASVFNKSFDIVYIENQGFLKNTLSLLDMVFKRHLTSTYIHHLEVDSLTLKVLKSDFAQVDGELIDLQETVLKGQTRYMYL